MRTSIATHPPLDRQRRGEADSFLPRGVAIARSRARTLTLACLATASLAGLPGCTRDAGPQDGRLDVVCTVGILADAVREIGGDRVHVHALMGPGVDPHMFKPGEDHLHRLRRADLVLYVGHHLEGKMAEIFARMSARQRVVAAAEAIAPERLRMPDGAQGLPDPHVWLDVALWAEVVTRAERALAEADPAGEATYRQNGARYRSELATLHDWTRAELARIPRDRRVLVTSHDAFGYFGAAYDVDVLGLQGISTVTEAGLHDVRRVVDLLVDRKIPAVFAETSVNDKGLRAVIEGARARGHAVRIGGHLYSDSLGAEGTPEGTYVGMVRANVRALVEALAGTRAAAAATAPGAGG